MQSAQDKDRLNDETHGEITMNLTKKLAAVCALALASAAQAAPVSIQFSTRGLSEAQSVEGSTFSGATFTSEAGDLHYTNSYGQGIFAGPGADSDVFISFAGSVDSVTVRAGDGAGDNDAFAISVYAFGTNAFLGTFSTPVFGGVNEPQWETLTVSGLGPIGKIVFDPGNAGHLPGQLGALGGVVITDLNFDTSRNHVPEPTSLALVGLGVASLAGLRSRRA